MPAHYEVFAENLVDAALHVWIGTTELDETTFLQYFDDDLLSEDVEHTDAGLEGRGFSADLGRHRPFDEDLLQVMWRPHSVPVRELIDETTLGLDDAAAASIVRACANRGIHLANAGFVYADPSPSIPDPRKTYNGLTYVGRYVP